MASNSQSMSEAEIATTTREARDIIDSLVASLRTLPGEVGSTIMEILDLPVPTNQVPQGVLVQRLKQIFSLPHLPVEARTLKPQWDTVTAVWWRIAVAYRPMVVAFVLRQYKDSSHQKDLISEGILSVYRSAQLYDSSRGSSFQTYSRRWLSATCRVAHDKLTTPHTDSLDDIIWYDSYGGCGCLADDIPDESPEANPEYTTLLAADDQVRDVRKDIIVSVKLGLRQRHRHIINQILDGVRQDDIAMELDIHTKSVQRVWRQFRQLCRDEYSRRHSDSNLVA